MPGAAGQLKKLYNSIFNPAFSQSVTEDIDGTVLERLEYIANRASAVGNYSAVADDGAFGITIDSVSDLSMLSEDLTLAEAALEAGYVTAFEHTGKGYLLGLHCSRAAAGIAYPLLMRLTLDGVQVFAGAITAATTSPLFMGIVGNWGGAGNSTTYAWSFPAFIPFTSQIKVEFSYAPDLGGSVPDLAVTYFAVYGG